MSKNNRTRAEQNLAFDALVGEMTARNDVDGLNVLLLSMEVVMSMSRRSDIEEIQSAILSDIAARMPWALGRMMTRGREIGVIV